MAVTRGLPADISRPRFWMAASFIYLSMLYSTGLHYVRGPETTVTTTYFTGPHREPPMVDSLIADRAAYERLFFDRGMLEGTRIEATGEHSWKLTDIYVDAGFYVLQAESLDSSVPPYKYRFLPTHIVRYLTYLTGKSIPTTFALFNVGLTFVTALLFTAFLRSELAFPDLLSLVGGMLFVSMLAVTSTLGFPMLEPASLFCVMVTFWAVSRRSVPLFIASSVAGVATKEVLVVTSLLWLVHHVPLRQLLSRNAAVNLAIACAPIAAFAAIRAAMGSSVAEVNYGFNVLAGEFPSYAERLLSPGRALNLTVRVFLAFSLLWIGLLNLGKNPFLLRSAIVVPAVIAATILLSSRVGRVLGVLFPIVIPAFLLFFVSPNGPAPAAGRRPIDEQSTLYSRATNAAE